MTETRKVANLKEKSGEERSKWKKNIDFIFGVSGASIGLGNVWRFPYLCYKNGGGVFLIPYVIFLIGIAVPLFFMEVAIGQLTSRSIPKAWDLFPFMKGIGFASLIISFNINTYYMTILAWTLRYIVASFSPVQPWSSCGNNWNTNSCYVYGRSDNLSNDDVNQTVINGTATSDLNVTRVSSVTEYWERGVLGLTKGVHHLGSVQLELLACVVVCRVIVYFSVWKGISWTSKIVYFTASFPIVMLFVLLIRGVTLPGAGEGISFYLKPNITKLGETQVWMDAAAQVFFSYCLTSGMLVAMGSYNTFHHNIYRDTIIFSFLNSGTSFFSGFTIFSILGFMAKEQNTTIATVAESGPGLVFIAYPKAVSLMPFPQVWGVLFFLMIFLLGLDSQFIGLESLVIAIQDLWPALRKRREILVAAVSCVQFLIGLTMITQGGIYVFYMFDNYAGAGWCVFLIGVCECVTISYLFGSNRFWNHVCVMLKFRPFPWFKFAWASVTPLLTFAIFLYSIVKYHPLTYNRTYQYPIWAQVICWCMTLSAFVWILGYAIYIFSKAKGSAKERWAEVSKQSEGLRERIEHSMKDHLETLPLNIKE